MKNIKKIVKFAYPFFKKEKYKIIVFLSLAMLASLLMSLQPILFGQVIDNIVPSNEKKLYELLIGLACILFFENIFAYISGRLQVLIGTNIEVSLKKNVFSSLLKLPVETFNKIEKGQLINNIDNDVNTFSNLFTSRFMIIVDIASVLLMMIILLNINIVLTLLLVLNVPISVFIFSYFGKKINEKVQHLKNFSDKLLTYIQETFIAFPIMKIFNKENTFLKTYNSKNLELYDIAIKKSNLNYTARVFSQLTDNFLYFLVIIVGIYFVFKGQLSVGSLVAFSSYSVSLTATLLSLTRINAEIEEVVVSVDRINNIQNTLSNNTEAQFIQKESINTIMNIELQNISYSFDKQMIFSGIYCELKKNHLYYLQGKNGSGKTTLLNLISGIFFNYSGDIIINKDLDLRVINLMDFRNNLAYIPQKTDMFTGSIYDNLTMFDKEISKKVVIEKCKSVGLHNDIMQLPDEYETIYGSQGVLLSGGQMQKIGIVRALIKEHSVYLCDEIYSSLDNNSADLVRNLFFELSKKTIVICIDHNFEGQEQYKKIKLNDELCLFEMSH